MVLWSVFFIGLGFFLKEFRPYFKPVSKHQELLDEWSSLQSGLTKIEESLSSGLALGEAEWREYSQFDPIWRKSFIDPLRALRSEGHAVIPTLKRSRAMLRFFIELFSLAQTRAAPARSQAWVCLALSPIVSVFFYFLLPTIKENSGTWLVMSSVAVFLGALAFAWVESLINQAVWSEAQNFGKEGLFLFLTLPEKLISLVHSGNAIEVAWVEALRDFPSQLITDELITFWGKEESGRLLTTEEKALFALKSSLHHSVLVGTPIQERVEGWAGEQRVRIESTMRKALELLPGQCLKPLFICTAPGVILLIFGGLILEMQSQLGGDF